MHHYSIDMRKMKRVIVISFVPFFLIWFIALNLIYTVKAVRKAFEIPNVTIQLNEPLFMVSVEAKPEPVVVGWHILDNGYALMRRYGRVWLSQSEGNAVVSIEDSQIISTKENRHVLSDEEIRTLLTKICNNESFDRINFTIKDYSRYSSEMTLVVSGDYDGFLALKDGHVTVPVDDTNLDQVWSAREHFPYMTVISCLVSSVIIVTFLSAIGFFVSKRANNIFPYLLINGIPAALLIAYLIFLSTAGYFAPI